METSFTMKKGTILVFTAVSLVLVWAGTFKQTNEIDKAQWLIGTWENNTQKGSIYETWSKINDNEFVGKSYLIQEKDTVIFENIRLTENEEGLFYIPIVKTQNEGLPVRFAAKEISASQLIFENPEHDFPQIISYTKISVDSLVAEISGSINGKVRKQVFPMNRVK